MTSADKIERYLREECQLNAVVAEQVSEKIQKYGDIRDEFLKWLETRSYEMESPVEVNGYTAARIHEMAPVLKEVGVYTFLTDLRDDPEKMIKYLEEGLPIK